MKNNQNITIEKSTTLAEVEVIYKTKVKPSNRIKIENSLIVTMC